MNQLSNLTESERLEVYNKDATVKVYMLYQIANILDLSAKKGTYTASESELIGLIYNKISDLITISIEKDYKKSKD
jgi:hypothetical protein